MIRFLRFLLIITSAIPQNAVEGFTHNGLKSLVLPLKTKSELLYVKEHQDASRNLIRRDFFNEVVAVSLGFISYSFIQAPLIENASASGGATAGGSYLISAKQRYNLRVKAGIKSFLGLSSDLEKNNTESTKEFFTLDIEGGWKDVSVAGYLLANAFRRSSNTAPDSLPSVKKWKAFAAEVESMQKSLNKKDINGLVESYGKARILLDAYLDAVQLPPSTEL